VYLDFLGITLWNLIPVQVEDIERIEVIRGPGSALYGADAYTGVVNIITRPPGENRTMVSVGAGNGQWLRGAFFSSGRIGRLAYRSSVGYEQRQTFSSPLETSDLTYQRTVPSDPDIGFRAPNFNLDLRGSLARNVVLRGGFAGGASRTYFQAIGPLRRYWGDMTFFQPYVQLDAGNFVARAFWNHFTAAAAPYTSTIGAPLSLASVYQDIVDLDLQYSIRSTAGNVQNLLQIGGGGRMKFVSYNYLDADHTLFFGSLFVQDTLRVSNRFSAVASVRMDYHPILDGPVFSPRAALIFRPTENRAIRLSGGTAFRTPMMTELYLNFVNPTPIPGVSVQGQGGEVDNNGGQLRLRPETAISVDLGYLDQTSDRVQFEADLFWTRGTDLIQLTEAEFNPLPGSQRDSSTGTRTIDVARLRFSNDPFASYVYGAELATRISPIDGLDFYANYTLAFTQHDPNALLAGQGLGPNGTAIPDQRTSQHKFNVGMQVRTRFGLDLEVFGHYASNEVWLEQVYDTVRGVRYAAFPLSDYFLLNGRIGFRTLNDRLDLGLVGYNLTDNHARQHPFGAPLTLRLMLTAAYRF
jgi:iron complex outermembrane receptor protein